jgi:glutamate-1-semialdehyde 2,1-aminomutase
MKATNAIAHMKKIGTMLMDGVSKSAMENGFEFKASGEPALFYFMVKEKGKADSLFLHQEWNAECMKRGAYITSHHNHFTNLAMTEADVKETIEICDDAFRAVKKNRPDLFGN